MRSKTVIVRLLSEEVLTNVLINYLIKFIIVKLILSATFALKMYYLFFKAEKTAAEVLKYNSSYMKLLC